MTVWISIDTKTNRIVSVGSGEHGQSKAKREGNEHALLSGNKVVLRSLKVGMTIGGYM